jgi:glycosyltransferase involved in cell wall biosynthesis
VSFRPIDTFDENEADRVLITFRSPNHKTYPSKAIKKLWWSTDQYTVGDFGLFHKLVDHVITISPHHSRYHIEKYGMPPEKLTVIDIGVKVGEYAINVPKIKDRLIYCSIPDRGLMQLHAAWALVIKELPSATLTITSDYRLWGLDAPGNHMHRLVWTDFIDNVSFRGRVKRSELVQLQLEAEILAYPCIYDELFCVSVAECQVAGAYPITSGFGALTTTNQFGTIIPGLPTDPDFVTELVRQIIYMLTDGREALERRSREMREAATARFSWDRIYDEWMKVIEK